MSESNNYEIIVKSNDQKKLRVISNLLIVSALATLLYFAFNYYYIPRLRSSAVFLFVVCAIIVTIWAFVILKKYVPPFRYAFFLAGIAMFFYFPHPTFKFVIGVLYIILGLIESIIRMPKRIVIDNSGVLINNFPGKFFEWCQISSMIIRDQLITINFKNNKLYQNEIEGYITAEIQKEFNDFAKNKTHSSENNTV